MKKHDMLAIILLFLIILFSCKQEANEKVFMSYNVKNCIGMDDMVDYARVAGVIDKVNPEVVAIQELDSATGRSKNSYVLGELAKLTGMHATYAPAIAYDGGKYGIGMLSKEEPVHVYRHALPGREEARILLVAEFKEYVYCCMHLSLTEEDRMASLPIIKKATSEFTKPVWIAGDWNDTPESSFVQELGKDFHILNVPGDDTFPSDEPNQTLDYIAVRKDSLQIGEFFAYVPEASVESDHRPVVVHVKKRR